jgi:rhamnogalacturonyl hydrolase YesR
MKRRNFLQLSSLAGIAAITIPNAGCSKSTPSQPENQTDKVIEKVKRAMLSMQRASWEHGLAAQAFVELGDDEMIVLMAKEAQLRQLADGRLAVLYTDNGVTDPASAGEAVLRAATITGDASLKEAADKMVGYLLNTAPKSADGTLHHTINAPEIWVDSIYMAPPFLAVAGYHQEAVKQIQGMRQVLYNPTKKLYSHRWDAAKQVFINEKFWGVGNGWAAAGMARVINTLPDEMADEKTELIGYVKEVLENCIAHMREDFLFHNILDDTTSFVETNLGQMLAYTIFTGVKSAWLQPELIDAALKMREAAWKKVDEFGYVQGVCGAPYFNSHGRATEGQAFFLIMEAAYKKWDNK